MTALRDARTVLQSFETLYEPESGRWYMPPWLEQPFDPDRAEDWRCIYKNGWPAPVEREVGWLYAALVIMLRPRAIIETGTNAGYSTLSMAAALAVLGGERSIYTIDISAAEHLFKGTDAAHLVTFLLGSSLEISLDQLPPEVDTLVLDSDHRYGTIAAEINRFSPLLRVGGILITHDTMYYDGIALAIRQLMQSPCFEVLTLPTPRQHKPQRCTGMTIARKILPTTGDVIAFKEAYADIEVDAPGRQITDPPLV